MVQAAPLEQSVREVGGLAVGERFVLELLAGIEIRVVGAGDERRAGRESQDETAPEAQSARQVVSWREEDDPVRGRGIDGGLDGRGVLGFPVASSAVIANAQFGALARGRKRPREGEESGSPQESPAQQVYTTVYCKPDASRTDDRQWDLRPI